jgi:(R,R)-butanediol dehydrogenase/meso-butanediol dehydrogenase/diacetyl reductase
VEPLAVALHAVQAAGLSRNLRVAVLGSGPIGLGTLFWLKQLGIANVVVGSRSRRTAALAVAMGANDFITDGEPGAFADALGGAPDVVFECVGKPGVLDTAIRTVRGRGRVIVMGFCVRPDPIDLARCVVKEIQIGFSKTYCLADFAEVVRTLDKGITSPGLMVNRTLSLEALPEAIQMIRMGAPDCKIHIDPWGAV